MQNLVKIFETEISRLSAHLDKVRNIVIVVHTHPDGDAAGSSLAMASYLESKGKKATVVFPDPVEGSLHFLLNDKNCPSHIVYSENQELAIEKIRKSELIFCQDCNAFSRTGAMQDIFQDISIKKILIDHHLFPKTEEFDLCISTPEVSSTCELLFNILTGLQKGDISSLPEFCLNALMTGLTTDTNNFANSVFSGTLQMASSLISAGADRDYVLQNLYNRFRENRLRAMGYMLYERMKLLPNGVAYMIMDKGIIERFDLREGEMEGLVNMPLAIENVRLSILLKEDKDYFRVSIRSKKGTSANKLASSSFNGGGHENASGGRLFIGKDISQVSEAEQYIINSVKNV